ncbi:MAG: hypothetical protein R3E39_28745 [Anaerolineae bacterium]
MREVTEIRQHLESVEEKKRFCYPNSMRLYLIRMQEAWMLINEQAIKNAANNPRNSISLKLPKTNELERIPDPKNELYNRLRQASGLHGRRLAKFNPSEHVRRVSEFISDFSILTKLPAFRAMQEELVQVIADQSWNTSS